MTSTERFIFAWVNFFLLIGGLAYILRRPVREFLLARRERLRLFISRARRQYDEAKTKREASQKRFELADADAATLKHSLIETGSYGRAAIIESAKETVERIRRETELLTKRETSRTCDAISRETLVNAFEKAARQLSLGVSRDDELKLLDASLSAFEQMKERP